MTKANDTLDSRVSSTMDLGTVIPNYQHSYDLDTDHTYSSIPDIVFRTPVSSQANRSPYTLSHTSNYAPMLLQRCASTPNPAAKRQRYEVVNRSPRDSLNTDYRERSPHANYFQNAGSLRKTTVSANQVGLPTAMPMETEQIVDSSFPKLGVIAHRKGAMNGYQQTTAGCDAGYDRALLTGFIPNLDCIRHDKRQLLEIAVTHSLRQLQILCEEAYLDTLNIQNSLETLLVFDHLVPSSPTRQKIVLFIRFVLKQKIAA